ncbi:MAG: formylglycine-generating enzyme family protein [Bacteroidota bacterium]|nr:MAG: formylglycine-generating enzyme family protein [Bacteroidota bacterium]
MEDEIMKSINAIKKIALTTLLAFTFSLSTLVAQNDTMYVMKAGVVVKKYNVHTQVDSLIFYNPNKKVTINIAYVNIPAGTFIMGNPPSEEPLGWGADNQFQVTLSAFRISKYEITNAQYAVFLNAVGVGNDGKYAAGAYPTKILITASSGNFDWGLHYNTNKWEPVTGYENHPAINVSWYGAMEFATYVGGKLPTEAQWEYACRAGTTTRFNTGDHLTNLQANYDWAYPYTGGTNTLTTKPGKSQVVGTYPANAWGLYDMHGNVDEWVSDYFGDYPTTPQTNPTGASAPNSYSPEGRIMRGGGFNSQARWCLSAHRRHIHSAGGVIIGFRVVMAP